MQRIAFKRPHEHGSVKPTGHARQNRQALLYEIYVLCR